MGSSMHRRAQDQLDAENAGTITNDHFHGMSGLEDSVIKKIKLFRELCNLCASHDTDLYAWSRYIDLQEMTGSKDTVSNIKK